MGLLMHVICMQEEIAMRNVMGVVGWGKVGTSSRLRSGVGSVSVERCICDYVPAYREQGKKW